METEDQLIARLQRENTELRATVATLLARRDEYQARIDEFERRLGMNSQNSFQPRSPAAAV